MLPPAEGRCVRAARVLYSQILDRIVDNDYDVFSAARVTRADVPQGGNGVRRAWRVSHESGRWIIQGTCPS